MSTVREQLIERMGQAILQGLRNRGNFRELAEWALDALDPEIEVLQEDAAIMMTVYMEATDHD